uniref:MULE transposase domain-containing protein n=1 Tax=Lactuca sativa TaxID=4236 RepID=A0A9R1XVV8_LACSA|nr:hypothetical protein LSAT_V11C200055500 [Lactuca sativa]
MGDNEEIGDVISDETRTDGRISDDSDFLVDELNMVEDVKVNMKDFHSGVYSFPNLDNHQSFNAADVIVDEDLEVIDTQLFESAGVEEDERMKLMRRLKKPTTCSSRNCIPSETTLKSIQFELGETFTLQKLIKKKRIRAKCRGVVPEVTGRPWTKSRIKCKDKTVSSQKATCPWVVLISRSDEESDWMVKIWFMSIDVCRNPTIAVKALRVELQKTYEVGMSRMKVFKAKQLAQKHVYGDYQKQYSLLRDYVLELQQCNPGTTVKIDVYSGPNADLETRMFKRIYVCLGALKMGFKAGLRDFLGFDGAFMKGPYPRQVLTVVGLDSNNGIYPLAYAICLGEDLELSTNSNFTFISDRQKGILPAIVKLFPSAEHRFYLRHIHENMKEQQLDTLTDLWNIITSSIQRHVIG